jgi:hypothetical protein
MPSELTAFFVSIHPINLNHKSPDSQADKGNKPYSSYTATTYHKPMNQPQAHTTIPHYRLSL